MGRCVHCIGCVLLLWNTGAVTETLRPPYFLYCNAFWSSRPQSHQCFELSRGHQLIAEPAHPKVVTGFLVADGRNFPVLRFVAVHFTHRGLPGVLVIPAHFSSQAGTLSRCTWCSCCIWCTVGCTWCTWPVQLITSTSLSSGNELEEFTLSGLRTQLYFESIAHAVVLCALSFVHLCTDKGFNSV